jgi:histidine ammonia-lyase
MNLRRIIKNTEKIISIELYVAARGLELRRKILPSCKMGSGTKIAFDALRDLFPFKVNDNEWGKELEVLYDLIIKKSDLKNLLVEIAS